MLTTPSTQVYSIGDKGAAGGKIFYINPHYKSDSWHYLEVEPVSTEARFEWGSNGTKIKGTKKGIGTGQKNTTKIATWLNSHSENREGSTVL